MTLAQGRYWRAALTKGMDCVGIELAKGAPPEDLQELRLEIPLAKWNSVVKVVHSDRKLLGGFLLDFAKQKDRVSATVGNDRLLAEFQRVVLDATAALVEQEVLALVPPRERE